MSCDNCKSKSIENETEESFAISLVKEYAKMSSRWFKIAIVILCMWLATIGGFVWYLYQYDFSSETITVEQDGEGYNNYVGQDGSIYNGAENNSDKKEKNP